MTMRSFKTVLSGAIGLALVGQAMAAVVTTDVVSSYSSELLQYNREAENVSNNSFDTANANNPDAGPGHTSLPSDSMWLTLENDANPFIVIDLGAVYELTSVNVWNYNEAGSDGNHPLGYTKRGVATAEILTSETGTPNISRGVFTFAEAPGTDGYLGETFAFPYSARYVMIEPITNHGDAVGVEYGLSEVQFTAVPEPTAVGLLAIGSVAILRRRRAA